MRWWKEMSTHIKHAPRALWMKWLKTKLNKQITENRANHRQSRETQVHCDDDWMNNFGKFGKRKTTVIDLLRCVYFGVCKQQLSNTVAKFWLSWYSSEWFNEWHACMRARVCVCIRYNTIHTYTYTYSSARIQMWTAKQGKAQHSTADNRLECRMYAIKR